MPRFRPESNRLLPALQRLTSLSRLAGLSALLALASMGVACGFDEPTFHGAADAGASGSAGREAEGGAANGVGDAGATNEGGFAGEAEMGGNAGAAGEGAAGSSGSDSGGMGGQGGTNVNGGTGGALGSEISGGNGGSVDGMHWVGTWTASPYLADSTAQPPSSLTNAMLRQVTKVSLGGNWIRVQFSNLSGDGPVTIKSAHVALCKSTTTNATIDVTTDKALAFYGSAGVTIAKGAEVWSDPIDLTMPALSQVSITTIFGSVPSKLTGHAGSRTTSYLVPNGTSISAADLTASAQNTDHWYYISGIDVIADPSAKGLVAIGDSITDGRGSDTNKNNRWTDILAARLQNNPATANVSVMNQAIGGTALVGSSGTAAQARFARDVLGQSGVKYAIVLDGVNDIGGNVQFPAMKAAYDSLISAAHNKGVLIFGGTIVPFGGSGYYSVAHEDVRTQVNAYIRSGVFDGYIDFDAAVSDGASPPKLQTAYATWAQTDWLHPSPAGYKKMGDTPDLTLFTQ